MPDRIPRPRRAAAPDISRSGGDRLCAGDDRCVLGVVIWKSLEAKATALAGGRTDIQNLTHSLAEHASHTIRSADIAMAGMVDLLKYRDPLPERFNPYLAETVSSLPQLREIGVLDVDGKWRYSSFAGNTTAQQFRPKLLRLSSGHTRKHTAHQRTAAVTLDRTVHDHPSKRNRQAGRQLRRVLTAAIDSDYFNRFYKTFQLGPDGSISLLRNDGAVLIRWPFSDRSTNLSGTDLFSRYLKLSSVGYYKIISPSTVSRNTSAMRKRALSDDRHPGDVGRLAAWRIGGERYEPTPSLPACCCA